MKRLLVASLCLALLAVPAVTFAKAPTAAHRSQYLKAYHQVAIKLGKRAPGRNIVRDGLSTGKPLTDSILLRSLGELHLMLAPPPTPVSSPSPVQSTTTVSSTTSYAAPASSASGYASVPGVPASFAACVAMRESTNGAGSSNIYGILGPGGQGSISQQKAAFSQMYAARGTQPWAPYDGC